MVHATVPNLGRHGGPEEALVVRSVNGHCMCLSYAGRSFSLQVVDGNHKIFGLMGKKGPSSKPRVVCQLILLSPCRDRGVAWKKDNGRPPEI